MKLQNDMTNWTELIKREVNYSSSNKVYQASSKIQQTGECIDRLRVVRGRPQRVHRGEDQGKVLRETQNGEVNENSFLPYYYYSDSNNDSYYSVASRETVNVEILHKQLMEALKLIQVKIESSEKSFSLSNVKKYSNLSNKVPIPALQKHVKKLINWKIRHKTLKKKETNTIKEHQFQFLTETYKVWAGWKFKETFQKR